MIETREAGCEIKPGDMVVIDATGRFVTPATAEQLDDPAVLKIVVLTTVCAAEGDE